MYVQGEPGQKGDPGPVSRPNNNYFLIIFYISVTLTELQGVRQVYGIKVHQNTQCLLMSLYRILLMCHFAERKWRIELK